jgi:hypothetical protein
MTANDWITRFLVGGLFGALGQGVRVVVGLKKLNDSAVQSRTPLAEVFSASTLLVSLLIGFVAGVLGMLSADVDLQSITRQNILLLIGTGYAGADFIEGFVRKNIPGAATDATTAAGRAAPAAASPAPTDDVDLQAPVG